MECSAAFNITCLSRIIHVCIQLAYSTGPARARAREHNNTVHNYPLARMRREGYSSCLVCVCLYVCMYVCMYVCLSEHAILAVRAIKSITKDAIVLSVRFAAILKRCFS